MTLNRISWRDLYPKFPIVPVSDADGNSCVFNEEDLLVKCIKLSKIDNRGRGFQLVPLKVCLHSPVRFDAKSKRCKTCFGLRKGQSFPDLFLKAKKVVHYQEVLKITENEEEKEE